MSSIRDSARATRVAAARVAGLEHRTRVGVLLGIAECLEAAVPIVQMMNAKDIQSAKATGLSDEAAGRLRITTEEIGEIVAILREMAALPDPIADSARRPLGVVFVVDQVDPLGIIRAFALCFMAGNASILRGHDLARESSITLMKFIHAVLVGYELPADMCLVPYNATTEELADLFTASDLVDLAITLGDADLHVLATGHAAMPLIAQPAGAPHFFAGMSSALALESLTAPHAPNP